MIFFTDQFHTTGASSAVLWKHDVSPQQVSSGWFGRYFHYRGCTSNCLCGWVGECGWVSGCVGGLRVFVLEIQCVCHVDEWVNVSEWVAVGVVWGCLCYRASVFRHSYSVCGWVYLCCKCQHVYSWYVCVCVCWYLCCKCGGGWARGSRCMGTCRMIFQWLFRSRQFAWCSLCCSSFMLHVSEISTMHEMFQMATQGEWINLFLS